jgi:hypothetical protein
MAAAAAVIYLSHKYVQKGELAESQTHTRPAAKRRPRRLRTKLTQAPPPPQPQAAVDDSSCCGAS